MPVPNETILVLREWIGKAENDLKSAAHLLGIEGDCPTDTVCFHAQQCAEKYPKAFLVLQGTDFPKTHDIEELMALIPEHVRPELAEKEQARSTDYATVTRYPADYERIPLTEARQAVEIARRVRKEVRRLLPKEALRLRRK